MSLIEHLRQRHLTFTEVNSEDIDDLSWKVWQKKKRKEKKKYICFCKIMVVSRFLQYLFVFTNGFNQ